jgi:predicted DNA-binding transcriptional regulator AlpA
VRTKAVLALTGASLATLYRWMERHPKLTEAEPDSPRGHAFPKPIGKEGREVIWDESAVDAWWTANADSVRRDLREKPVITLTPARFGEVMGTLTRSIDEEDSERRETRRRDFLSIRGIDPRGDQVRLTFDSISDAMLFKLKYA